MSFAGFLDFTVALVAPPLPQTIPVSPTFGHCRQRLKRCVNLRSAR
jgi:hypothetical protein